LSPLVSTFRPKTAQRDDDPWTEVSTVELPHAGIAARTCGVQDVADPDSTPDAAPNPAPAAACCRGPVRSVRVVIMQTHVPVPDVNRVAVVTCSSPAVAVAPALLDLFDAITGTFRLLPATDLLEGV